YSSREEGDAHLPPPRPRRAGRRVGPRRGLGSRQPMARQEGGEGRQEEGGPEEGNRDGQRDDVSVRSRRREQPQPDLPPHPAWGDSVVALPHRPVPDRSPTYRGDGLF